LKYVINHSLHNNQYLQRSSMPNPNALTGSFKDETIRHTRNHNNTALKNYILEQYMYL